MMKERNDYIKKQLEGLDYAIQKINVIVELDFQSCIDQIAKQWQGDVSNLYRKKGFEIIEEFDEEVYQFQKIVNKMKEMCK